MGRSRARAGIVAGLALLSTVALPLPGRAEEPSPLDGTPICGAEAPPIATPYVPDRDAVQVGTFNVLHSQTDEGNETLGARLPLAARAIAGAGIDVIGLQEVTRNVNGPDADGNEVPQRHGLVVQRLAAELARATGHRWEYCWARSNPHVPLTPDLQPGGGTPVDDVIAEFASFPDVQGGDFSVGEAILSRLDIDESKARARRLGDRLDEVPSCAAESDPLCAPTATFDSRQVLWAPITRPAGLGAPASKLDFFTTHIAHGITSQSGATKAEHIAQAMDVVREWSTADPWPDFLVGDFNSDHTTADRYGALVDAGFVDTFLAGGGAECLDAGDPSCSGGPVPDEQGPTESYSAGPRRAMSERIDFIWALPPAAGCVLEASDVGTIGHVPARQPDGRWLWASDHLGFRASVAC
jgi:endonuclease/exonuclease/phosphatase family metal-dependent hydrolase